MTCGISDTGQITSTPGTETAVLAGGWLWGMEDLIRRQPGVLGTRVGYTGGENDHATYRHHPRHAEAVEIVFDPTKTTYREILAFFFQIHDPSTLNREGNDIGTSYRSAIFPLTPEQEQIIRDTIADVDATGLWPGKSVTTVEPAGPFWEAEPEHQDYLERHPNSTSATSHAQAGSCPGAPPPPADRGGVLSSTARRLRLAQVSQADQPQRVSGQHDRCSGERSFEVAGLERGFSVGARGVQS